MPYRPGHTPGRPFTYVQTAVSLMPAQLPVPRLAVQFASVFSRYSTSVRVPLHACADVRATAHYSVDGVRAAAVAARASVPVVGCGGSCHVRVLYALDLLASADTGRTRDEEVP